MGKQPDSTDCGRRFLREAIERKLNFHGLAIGIAQLETAGKVVDSGEHNLWWLLPGWWEWAVAEDARKRLEECTCDEPHFDLCEVHD